MFPVFAAVIGLLFVSDGDCGSDMISLIVVNNPPDILLRAADGELAVAESFNSFEVERLDSEVEERSGELLALVIEHAAHCICVLTVSIG
mmetsp:Transcript_12336/g.14141  ORF Transcript_12336/g.14141 Transcript_12336/m.14141 type:complete len:90 (+) Transcript_12336:173-442(+)